jgi:hypothetical protein
MGVTIDDDARAIVATLPRSYDAVVRDRFKFRVGQIVYAAFSDAKPMIFMHGLLPDRTFDAFMRRATGIPGQLPGAQPAGA